MPDAGRRHMKQQVILLGTDSSEFEIAVKRLDAMLVMLEGRLTQTDYLVGNQLTIADIVYSPYITRLDHLNMQYMWADKPGVTAWYQALQQTEGYQKGIRAAFNDQAIAKLGAAGDVYATKIAEIIAA